MRVLLAAKYIPGGRRPIGGVQSWIGTVGAELRRRGHEVELWEPGMPPAGWADAALLANLQHTRHLADNARRVVQVCHGLIDEEAPGAGVAGYVFVTPEVREHWLMPACWPVVRQPIDTAFWSPAASRPEGGPLVRYSYRSGLQWLGSVAERLGVEYLHLRDADHASARDVLRRASCVLASGRAALEAMACGAPVVICDNRSTYQPALLATPAPAQIDRNYSGRGGVQPTAVNVEAAARDAIAAGSQRDWVLQHHDARRITEELLCCIS